jgi:hypothetical protein
MADEVFKWQPGTRREGERWSEDEVIASAITVYQTHVASSYRLTRRPDHEIRNVPAIDAIVHGDDSPALAIEHTRVESFSAQLLDDAVVTRLLGAFQQELARDLPEGVSCAIPVQAFTAGFNWEIARSRIASYLRELVPNLSPGASLHDIRDVPFPIRVRYEPELRIPFRFWRIAPDKNRISTELLASMEKALLHKKVSLLQYRASGYRTVLLIELADLALVGHVEPYRAFLAAERNVGAEHADDVLFGATEDPYRIYWFGFKGDEVFLDGLNMPNLRLGPDNGRFWLANDA